MDAGIDRGRLIVPAAGGFYEIFAPYGLTVIRVALGAILIPHGYGKLFLDDAVHAAQNFVHFGWALPLAWAYAIGALEFFGGILLVLGLFTRLVAAAFAIEMGVIVFAVLWPNWEWNHHGMEYPVLMGLVALGLFLTGGGRASLDRLLGKEF